MFWLHYKTRTAGAAPAAHAEPRRLGLPANLPAAWRRLKDGFALPLVAEAARGAGLAPPWGLTALPLELQLAVLGKVRGQRKRERKGKRERCVEKEKGEKGKVRGQRSAPRKVKITSLGD